LVCRGVKREAGSSLEKGGGRQFIVSLEGLFKRRIVKQGKGEKRKGVGITTCEDRPEEGKSEKYPTIPEVQRGFPKKGGRMGTGISPSKRREKGRKRIGIFRDPEGKKKKGKKTHIPRPATRRIFSIKRVNYYDSDAVYKKKRGEEDVPT